MVKLVLRYGNPERRNIEVIQAYYNPTRNTTQYMWGYAVTDNKLKIYYKDPTNRTGWIVAATVGTGGWE